MRNRILLLLAAFVVFSSFVSDKPAYSLYNAKGKKVKFSQLIKQAQQADVVFFGELHNNPISHWLQYELTLTLIQQFPGKVILGAEMMEADNQAALNAYLNDFISRDSLRKSARLWTNYKTDIEPLVNLAKENRLPFIATNIPRSYASMVYRNGFEVLDTLPDDRKAFIAPLPVAYDPELPGYLNMLKMMEGHGSPERAAFFPMAQAIKDATMAWFIHQNYRDGHKFIHFNGAYHSDNYEGILWYLQRLRPELRVLTISTIETGQPIVFPKEKRNVADFIIAVPQSMTKTH